MKLNTKEKVQNRIDKSLSWRKKEMTAMFFHINSVQGELKSVLCKSFFASLYGHYEGFFKDCFFYLLEFLNYSDKKYGELIDAFVFFEIKKYLTNSIPKRTDSIHRLTKYINTCCNLTFQNNPEKAIDMESNLNSDLLNALLEIFGIDKVGFELKYTFIDSELLNKRNRIAHGEFTIISYEDFITAYHQIKELNELIRENVLNYIGQDMYLKT